MVVPEFYRGKSIFITGGTGFVGKVLIEKLLRSCPEVGTIYLLMRQKKGVSCEERLRELCSQRVFERVRSINPDCFKKLKVINGDITEEELGISEEDKNTLQKNVHIIFHSAACVRFDQKLKDAVNMNTTGTLRVLNLAEGMEKVEVFLHLSTAFCRSDLDVLEEKLYPPAHKPRKIMDMVSWMDDDTLNYLEPKLISPEPNTYGYTKSITEDLVAEFSGKFPIAIARPSIVAPSVKEPMPGWVDNKNGPMGLIIGSGKGVIRSMHCVPTYGADVIAVDVVANACILIAYVTANDRPEATQVYNLTLSGVNNITWAEIISRGEKWVNEYPFTVALWYPGGSIKAYNITHQIDMFFTMTLPAYFVDGLLYLLGRDTFMIKLHQRIKNGLNLVHYYAIKEWKFKNTNYQGLRNKISKEDDEIFFTDLSNIDRDNYLKGCAMGIREYVCKEDPSTLPRARRLHRIGGVGRVVFLPSNMAKGMMAGPSVILVNGCYLGRYFVDRILKLFFLCVLIWFLYSNFSVFSSSMELLDNTLKSAGEFNPFFTKHKLTL